MSPRSTTLAALGAAGLTFVTGSAATALAAVQSDAQPTSARIALGERNLNVQAGRRALVRGSLEPRTPGVPVALQVQRAGRWHTLARTRTRARGAFTLRHRPRRPLSARARARAGASTTRSLGRLNVYRSALASWYGPGLYGQHLGCGGTLTAGRLGVAHKSLPCGAKLTLRHGRRTVRVRVIDRGPYAGAREFDLTAATAQRLGFGGHGTILTTR